MKTTTMTMRHVTLPALACLLAACDGAGPYDVHDAGLIDEPVEVVVAFGQTEPVGGTTLRVRFTGVPGDSRCPVDVTCVWEGNARVEIAVAAGAGAFFPLVLNSTLDPRHVDWNGVRVTLVEVTPEPRSTVVPDLADYGITLRLEPIVP